MAYVKSRVNGLKITIPNDARGVIHRFAIGGGGNELVFEKIKRSQFEMSKRMDSKPVELDTSKEDDGHVEVETEVENTAVELTINVEEDEPVKAAPHTPKKKAAKKKAAKKKAAKKTGRKEPAPGDGLEL